MIILFGSRVKRSVIGQTKTAWFCERCNNERIWPVVRDRNWFTLFFIPVIPLNASQHVICPVCGNALRIHKENQEEILPILDIQE